MAHTCRLTHTQERLELGDDTVGERKYIRRQFDMLVYIVLFGSSYAEGTLSGPTKMKSILFSFFRTPGIRAFWWASAGVTSWLLR